MCDRDALKARIAKLEATVRLFDIDECECWLGQSRSNKCQEYWPTRPDDWCRSCTARRVLAKGEKP